MKKRRKTSAERRLDKVAEWLRRWRLELPADPAEELEGILRVRDPVDLRDGIVLVNQT